MKFMRLKDVLNCTGLSRAVLYTLLSEQAFPPSFPLSGTTVAWLEKDVQNWIESRIDARNNRVKNNYKGDK